MSIYPVKLIEWYPPRRRGWKDKCNYEAAFMMVKLTECLYCGKKTKYKTAWGHHSIPYGHGDIWCNARCLKKWRNKK